MRARYWLSRAVFLRSLGVVYAIAFVSLARQLKGLFGEHGLLPAAQFLAGQKAALGVSGFVRVPSLFWLSASDGALTAALAAGVVLALMVVGGFASAPLLGALWLSYLSFVSVGQGFLQYPADLLLLETGFLAVFIAPSSGWRPRSDPPPAVVWLLRWLLFRVLIGAGIAKLRSDPCWAGLTCFPRLLETSPSPTLFAAYFHVLPNPFQRVANFAVLFAELVVPFGVFGPRRVRHIAGAVTIAVSLLAILSSNAAFASVLTAVIAVACFDDEAVASLLSRVGLLRESHAVRQDEGKRGAFSRVATFVATAGVLALGVARLPEVWSPTPGGEASVEPFHLVNTYGAIEPVENERAEVVFEGTWDDAAAPGEVHWFEYELPCKPGDPRRMLCLPSLFPKRLGLRLWQAALGDFRREAWVVRLVDDLLREDAAVTHLFTVDPFAGRPPRFVRALRYRYRYAKGSEPRYWQRENTGEFIRPFSLEDPALYEFLLRKGWLAARASP